jgi:hypothetical protein
MTNFNQIPGELGKLSHELSNLMAGLKFDLPSETFYDKINKVKLLQAKLEILASDLKRSTKATLNQYKEGSKS